MVTIPKGKKVFNAVLNRADVIGGTFGLFEKLGGIGGAAYHITQLITKPVAPNWFDIMAEAGQAVGIDIALVIAGIAGMALDIPGYNKYFSAAAKYGAGKILGSVIGTVITHSHNPHGGKVSTMFNESPVWTQTRKTGTTTSARQLNVTASTPSMLPAR